jgi:hypothetical protein
MPEQPRHLGTRCMAEMTGGVEDIRACAGDDRVEVPRWRPGRLIVLRRVTSRGGWFAETQACMPHFLATVSHARQAQRIQSEKDCNQ